MRENVTRVNTETIYINTEDNEGTANRWENS